MRDSFSEYKKTLENSLMQVYYLYNGDALSSVETSYSEIKETPLTSPSFIISTIHHIYKQSFNKLVEKSKTILIPEEFIYTNDNLTNSHRSIFEHFSLQNITSTYIFCSDKSKNLIGTYLKTDESRGLPGYFYPLDTLTGSKSEVFLNPFIKEIEEEGELVIFISDSGIQSLVYSIQNMDYIIESIDTTVDSIPHKWKHTIKYNLYDCNFNSYKVIIKNLQKTRQDKLNKILDGN